MQYDFREQILKVGRSVSALNGSGINSMSLWNAIANSELYKGYYNADLRIIFLSKGAIKYMITKHLQPCENTFGYAIPNVMGTMVEIYLTWILKYHITYEQIYSKVPKEALGKAASWHRGLDYDACLAKANEQFADILESL